MPSYSKVYSKPMEPEYSEESRHFRPILDISFLNLPSPFHATSRDSRSPPDDPPSPFSQTNNSNSNTKSNNKSSRYNNNLTSRAWWNWNPSSDQISLERGRKVDDEETGSGSGGDIDSEYDNVDGLGREERLLSQGGGEAQEIEEIGMREERKKRVRAMMEIAALMAAGALLLVVVVFCVKMSVKEKGWR